MVAGSLSLCECVGNCGSWPAAHLRPRLLATYQGVIHGSHATRAPAGSVPKAATPTTQAAIQIRPADLVEAPSARANFATTMRAVTAQRV